MKVESVVWEPKAGGAVVFGVPKPDAGAVPSNIADVVVTGAPNREVAALEDVTPNADGVADVVELPPNTDVVLLEGAPNTGVAVVLECEP